jgi:hypothetical protein
LSVTLAGEQKLVAPEAVMDATGCVFTTTVRVFEIALPQLFVTTQS